MTAQSANEIIEECHNMAKVYKLPILKEWEDAILEQVHIRNLSPDDKIFILNADGSSYEILMEPEDDNLDAYERSMRGI